MSDKAPPPATGKDLARKPRGFPDKREGLIQAQARLVETVTGVYRQWGFEALDTGAFEYADALGKFLPDDDRPNAGVFSMQDDDEQWMALRYDLTAPLARFVAEQGQGLGRAVGGAQFFFQKGQKRFKVGIVCGNQQLVPNQTQKFQRQNGNVVSLFHVGGKFVYPVEQGEHGFFRTHAFRAAHGTFYAAKTQARALAAFCIAYAIGIEQQTVAGGQLKSLFLIARTAHGPKRQAVPSLKPRVVRFLPFENERMLVPCVGAYQPPGGEF